MEMMTTPTKVDQSENTNVPLWCKQVKTQFFENWSLLLFLTIYVFVEFFTAWNRAEFYPKLSLKTIWL